MIKRIFGILQNDSDSELEAEEADKLNNYRADPSAIFEDSEDEDQKGYHELAERKKRARKHVLAKKGIEYASSDEEEEKQRFKGAFQCKLCPHKVIASQQDLDKHLLSKSHLKNVKKYYRVMKRLGVTFSAEEEAEIPDELESEDDVVIPEEPQELESDKEIDNILHNGSEYGSGDEESDDEAELQKIEKENKVDGKKEKENVNENKVDGKKEKENVVEKKDKEGTQGLSNKQIKKKAYWEKRNEKKKSEEGKERRKKKVQELSEEQIAKKKAAFAAKKARREARKAAENAAEKEQQEVKSSKKKKKEKKKKQKDAIENAETKKEKKEQEIEEQHMDELESRKDKKSKKDKKKKINDMEPRRLEPEFEESLAKDAKELKLMKKREAKKKAKEIPEFDVEEDEFYKLMDAPLTAGTKNTRIKRRALVEEALSNVNQSMIDAAMAAVQEFDEQQKPVRAKKALEQARKDHAIEKSLEKGEITLQDVRKKRREEWRQDAVKKKSKRRRV